MKVLLATIDGKGEYFDLNNIDGLKAFLYYFYVECQTGNADKLEMELEEMTKEEFNRFDTLNIIKPNSKHSTKI